VARQLPLSPQSSPDQAPAARATPSSAVTDERLLNSFLEAALSSVAVPAGTTLPREIDPAAAETAALRLLRDDSPQSSTSEGSSHKYSCATSDVESDSTSRDEDELQELDLLGRSGSCQRPPLRLAHVAELQHLIVRQDHVSQLLQSSALRLRSNPNAVGDQVSVPPTAARGPSQSPAKPGSTMAAPAAGQPGQEQLPRSTQTPRLQLQRSDSNPGGHLRTRLRLFGMILRNGLATALHCERMRCRRPLSPGCSLQASDSDGLPQGPSAGGSAAGSGHRSSATSEPLSEPSQRRQAHQPERPLEIANSGAVDTQPPLRMLPSLEHLPHRQKQAAQQQLLLPLPKFPREALQDRSSAECQPLQQQLQLPVPQQQEERLQQQPEPLSSYLQISPQSPSLKSLLHVPRPEPPQGPRDAAPPASAWAGVFGAVRAKFGKGGLRRLQMLTLPDGTTMPQDATLEFMCAFGPMKVLWAAACCWHLFADVFPLISVPMDAKSKSACVSSTCR
jgi:hypothetical protein